LPILKVEWERKSIFDTKFIYRLWEIFNSTLVNWIVSELCTVARNRNH
jgi:hypothetical protein